MWKKNSTKEGLMALSLFSKLKEGLDKTRKGITDKLDDLFNNYGEIDDELFDELEEILIVADVGMQTTMKLIDSLREELKVRRVKDASEVKAVFKDVVEMMLKENNSEPFKITEVPTIIMVIGVNGVGKTTSIGKIAHHLKEDGKSVLIAAADTFRAAAIEQLKVWGDRVGVNVIHQSEGSDPAAVIFDAIQSAKAKKTDVLICDTAGRLHNKVNLMNELAKVFRVIEREYPEAKKEVLLVLDATTGQNAVQQAKVFNEAAQITGIVLTKLDGTAKGGVVMAINSELQIPVKLIGVGEGMNDLQPFDAHEFVEALFN
jgi:fused signal recognition particle receptor